MNRIRYKVTGLAIPNYIIDILVRGRCEFFLNMSIVREGTSYVFTCDSNNYEEFDITSAVYEDKLKTLLRLIDIKKQADNRLITSDNYMISQEVMRKHKGLDPLEGLKLLFYPDVSKKSFGSKVAKLISEMSEGLTEKEKELFEQVRSELESGDIFRAETRLEKALYRIEKAA